MEKSQLMKGILENCILKILEKDETYGYEIPDSFRNMVFPILKKELYTLFFYVWKRNH